MEYIPVPPPEELNKISLFFIIGRSRTGTTLLRSMLDVHPRLMVPLECTFMLQLARKYNHIKSWDDKVIAAYLRDLKKTWLFYDLQVNDIKLEEFLCRHAKELNYITVCKAVLMHSPVSTKKTDLIWVGDKNPSYSVHFDRIFRIFGNQCKYIFMIRDYRDQFVSLRKAGIEIPGIAVSTKRWVAAFKSFERHSRENAGVFYFLKYEDLVAHPEAMLKEICAFLGILYDPSMLHFNENPAVLHEKYSRQIAEGIHQSLLDPVSMDKAGVWKSQLDEQKTGIADFIAGKNSKHAGYEGSGIINPLKYFVLSLPGVILYYFVHFSEKLVSIAPFRIYIKLSNGAYLGKLWNKYFRKQKRP